MCVNIGHGARASSMHPEAGRAVDLRDAVHDHRSRARLGAKLAEITPGDIDVFFFTNGGADANENAIKIARVHTGRQKIVSFYRSYHGATAGAMAATGEPRGWLQAPLPGFIHVVGPYHGLSRKMDTADDALRHLDEVIQLEGPRSIAGLMIEPVRAPTDFDSPDGTFRIASAVRQVRNPADC